MMWLSWRQFRAQALAAVCGLAVIAAYMAYVGSDIRDAYDVYRASCEDPGTCVQARSLFRSTFQNTLLLMATGLALIPALIGTFWGAPLIAREMENATHRLVWNQSITRRRWLLSKILLIGLAAIAVTGAASALLTWAARPFDQVVKEQFDTFVFSARNIAPLGYAALAFTIGTVVGLLLRRTVPAMAVTLILFLAFQFFFPNIVRPSLMPPEKSTLPMSAQAINQAQNLGGLGGGPVIGGVKIPDAPDAWVAETSALRTADGKNLSGAKFNACLDSPPKTGGRGTFGDTAVCLAKHNIHVDVQYHPASRYWTFQWLETGIYLVLSVLLTAFALRRIRRRVS